MRGYFIFLTCLRFSCLLHTGMHMIKLYKCYNLELTPLSHLPKREGYVRFPQRYMILPNHSYLVLEDEPSQRFLALWVITMHVVFQDVDADDEKALEMFMSHNPPVRRTLADIIMEKITEKQTEIKTQLSGNHGNRSNK